MNRSSVSHTPGPWIIFGDGDIGELEIMPAGRPGSITSIIFTSTDETTPEAQEKLANARLIAAAPDMLRCLRVLVDAYGIPDNQGREAPIIKNARAAITKATDDRS